MRLLILLIVFLAVYAELSVIINVGAAIGTGSVLLLLILTAVVGIWLVRLQGFGVYRRMSEAASRGEAPVDEMMHGVLLLLAGFFLIIPGFITDGLGALLLIPFVRQKIITHGLFSNTRVFYTSNAAGRRQNGVIEGEYSREDKPDKQPPALEKEKKNKPGP